CRASRRACVSGLPSASASEYDGRLHPMKRRRSLTHVGGPAEKSGDPDLASKLAEALDVAPAPEPRRSPEPSAAAPPASAASSDDPDRQHVHGFHAYPARMHPITAARLVAALS